MDFSTKISVVSNDEIGALAASFNALMENLQIKTNDLMCMMQHMHSGLFTIVEDETIHREYSAYIENIFGTSEVAGRDYSDLLFSQALISSDVLDQVRSAVSSLLGAPELMFAFNAHLLVKELTVQVTDGAGSVHDKILELDWDPIVNAAEISKILVSVRDVTEIRALQAATLQQKMDLEIVGQILKITPTRFSAFMENALELVDRNEVLVRATAEKKPEIIAELFANMHTIKGNARTYQLTYITQTLHETESTYDELRRDQNILWSQVKLLDELRKVKNALQQYNRVMQDKLSFNRSSVGLPPVDLVTMSKTDYQSVIKQLEPIVLSSREATDYKRPLSQILNVLRQADTISLSEALEGLQTTIPDLAVQLGKAAPSINFEGDKLFLYRSRAATFINVFSHVLKNAIDHGIESVDERKAIGKLESGAIYIHSKVLGDKAIVEVWDDGRGINLRKLRSKMCSQGGLGPDLNNTTPQHIADGIFLSGVSTAETLTDVSGRGVGMDAVKKFLNDCQCDIQVILLPNATLDSEHAFFRLQITLASSVAFIPIAESQEAPSNHEQIPRKVS